MTKLSITFEDESTREYENVESIEMDIDSHTLWVSLVNEYEESDTAQVVFPLYRACRGVKSFTFSY